MRSKTTRRFRRSFAQLLEPIKDIAREAYRQFVDNPDHPGLRFKRVHSTEQIYSVRITRDYRALGIREDNIIVWFWIGSHADYDELLSRI